MGTGGKIDFPITDLVMPGVDRPKLVQQVRRRYPKLKVICISSYTEDVFRQRLVEGKQLDFLTKPFNLQQSAGKVKEVLDAYTPMAAD